MSRTQGGGPAGPPPSASHGGTFPGEVRDVLARRGIRLTRQRTLLIGLGALLATLALVLALVLGDSDDAPDPVPLPAIAGTFIDQELGVTVAYPEGWKADRDKGVVEIRRRDRTGLVTVASPAPANDAREVLSAAVGESTDAYRRVERLGSQRLTLGGRPAEARTLLGTNDGGARLRILLAGVRGERRAYLVSAFFPRGQDLRLLEIERILNSLRFGR